MRESRSASQILFGFLPNQTVDVKNGVWKVLQWRSPKIERNVDHSTLRKELIRLASPWRNTNMDGGFVNDLEARANIQVVSLDRNNGVDLEPFPELWVCKSCRRIHNNLFSTCQCGGKSKGQLPFVGYHDKCGSIKQPYIKKCRTHNQVRINFPGTSSATEIKFDCPICNQLQQKGFGYAPCECGDGNLSFNVHRSSTVYTPRSVVIVNPPTPEKIKTITDSGGRPRALAWVVSGMKENSIEEIEPTLDILRRQLLDQKLPEELVEQMILTAKASGKMSETADLKISLSKEKLEAAEDQAIIVALAATSSRTRIQDLVEASDPMSELGILYREKYNIALNKAGIEAVELIDKFPVLSGHFGYTRGKPNPGESKLKPFRDRHGTYQIYADVSETEALFIRLSAVKVAKWLVKKGYSLPNFDDEVSARIAILENADLPNVTQDLEDQTIGSEIFTLIHSYSHRFIRLGAVWAGIDRNSLSELLVPLHLGFYVYAAARGDFVLGGLQAMFESDLDKLLQDFVMDEHRCPLDPGCSQNKAACVACLHLGEPSCRCFNRLLSRTTLTGKNGYLENL